MTLTDNDQLAFRSLLKNEERRRRDAVRQFCDAAVSGDRSALLAAIEKLSVTCEWRRAMRSVARTAAIPAETRIAFVDAWIHFGDHIRCQCSDDGVLARGLRQLLPPYEGAPVRLFRGDSLFNRKRRSYGLSWTSDREVAESFANGIWRTFDGGSVLLATVAPPTAVICQMPNECGEAEFVIDRRYVVEVDVLKRFDQISFEQLQAKPR